jgi:rubrerythrin
MALSREEIDQIAKAIAEELTITIRRYSQSYEEPKSVKEGLAQSMGEELTASMWYQLRARKAQDEGDTKTAELYRHIAEEENQHYNEFSRRRNELFVKLSPESVARTCPL